MPSTAQASTTNQRFELPALDLNFGNITDGTNIPPPPASPLPVVPTPPTTPPRNGNKPTKPNGNLAGNKRPAEDAPLSPAASSRQGSLRRLLSRSKLNSDFAEGSIPASNAEPALSEGRPQSRGGFSFMGERSSKRASGFFRRFSRSGDQPPKRRASFLFGNSSGVAAPKPTGPPPPMIPELKELEKDEGSLGADDLFKNIK